MTDRLTSVAADFRKQRTWPPRMTGERSLEELWDMVRSIIIMLQKINFDFVNSSRSLPV